MVTAPLVEPDELSGFPGAPFSAAVVESAAASVRRDTGWHIAPSAVETVGMASAGGQLILLPTLHLTSVAAVRDVTDPDNPKVLTGWSSAATARFRAGVLYRRSGWPCGDIEADIVHGYDSCPPDLMPAIAGRCQGARVNRATGSVRLGSLSIGGDGPAVTDDLEPAVAAYRILRSR